MSQETELKLAFPPATLQALRAHPVLAAGAPSGPPETLVNTYFDTPGLELRRDRIAVRLRKAGTRWLQTVKCAAPSAGGLSSRPEWERPRAPEGFAFGEIDDSRVRQRLEGLASRLVPVFTTHFARETIRLAPREGVEILAMIDQGEVEAAGQRAPISELELELVQGTADDLFAVAITLARDLPLAPEDVSKAQRGYELFNGLTPRPLRGHPSPVAGGQTATAALQAIGLNLIAQWQANYSGVTRCGEPEFIHQTRVALRRLRSAMTLFATVLPAADARTWRERLGELASGLGGARDADVLYDTLLKPIEAAGRIGEDMQRLIDAVNAYRIAARERFGTTNHHGLAQLELAAALHALPTADGPTVDDLARDVMQQVRRKARRCVEAAEEGDVTELHRLRIVLKRLRYGLEFFGPLWPAATVTRYGEALAALQEDLGRINDAAVGNRLLAEIAGRDPGLIAARAFTAGWHAPEIARLRVRALERARLLLWGRTPWKRSRHD